ncbi:MAG: FtsX-like permease family protein [Chloroflexota bacterium]|nr:FtsX-like permease family protein [Chloroflexota bacterium]
MVLGSLVVQQLFAQSGGDPLGQTLRINGQLFHVVGTLQAKGTGSDNAMFIPFSTLQQRLRNSPSLSQINIQIDNVNNVTLAQQDITTLLEKIHHIQQGAADDFRAYASNQLIQNAQANTAILTGLLNGLAAISLTVGGIGIMNIMLVSVTERTREIGIRMAVGARGSDIRNQFLLEALLLSVIGGIIGILVGLLGGYELVHTIQEIQIPFVVTPVSIFLPVGVAVVIGIFFGFYPAVLASRLDPITALRAE